jgi:hypothetical protein
MVQKTVILARLITLFLCLLAKQVSGEEGTVLLDTKQGIDETLNNAAREMKAFSESLKSLEKIGLEDNDNSNDGSGNDEESVNEKPIDETRQAKPIKSTPVDATSKDTEALTAEKPAAETPSVELPKPGEASLDLLPAAPEGTVLIDTEQGIDETQ